MANNRLYLKFNPTGKKIMLAKRMGGGWYPAFNIPQPVQDKLDEFFNECFNDVACTDGHRDDFCIELEIPVEENTPLVI